jgi:hypothetical protein
MACPSCQKLQWPGAYCQACGLAKLQAKHGDTARFSVLNRGELIQLSIKPGEIARHCTTEPLEGAKIVIERQWLNDGQGVEFTWAVCSPKGPALKGSMYLPYEQVSAFSDPELTEQVVLEEVLA